MHSSLLRYSHLRQPLTALDLQPALIPLQAWDELQSPTCCAASTQMQHAAVRATICVQVQNEAWCSTKHVVVQSSWPPSHRCIRYDVQAAVASHKAISALALSARFMREGANIKQVRLVSLSASYSSMKLLGLRPAVCTMTCACLQLTTVLWAWRASMHAKLLQ